jgi:hypothetical protein
MRQIRRPFLPGIALVLVLIGTTIALKAQAPATTEMSKPLTQFTIGDVFPEVTDESLRQTGRDWQSASAPLRKWADERAAGITRALGIKRNEIRALESKLRSAKKDKDFTGAGTLEGQIKTEKIVVGVLEELSTLSKAQSDAATDWREAGAAMAAFAKADEKFNAYRAVGIARPEDGATGERLSGEGYTAVLQHAQSLSDLGKAYSKLGSDLQDLGDRRKDLLSSLEKGGHVLKP